MSEELPEGVQSIQSFAVIIKWEICLVQGNWNSTSTPRVPALCTMHELALKRIVARRKARKDDFVIKEQGEDECMSKNKRFSHSHRSAYTSLCAGSVQ